MTRLSNTTTVVSVRLPNAVVATIKDRCKSNRFDSISAYLRERIIYDVTRKHQKYMK